MFFRPEITIDTKPLEKAIGRLRGAEMARIQVRALEKHATQARKEVLDAFTSRGVGGALYGGRGGYHENAAGAAKLITVTPPKVEGALAYVKITLKGFAVLQEFGGRTRPHVIKPKSAALLAFGVRGAAGFGGEMVFTKIVNHPGSRVPRHQALKPAAERAMARVIADIWRDVSAAWEGKAA